MQRAEVQQYYRDVRQTTVALCHPLATEDYVVQPVAYVSPPKWPLAHTTWFFETFILQPYMPGYQPYHDLYGYLWNSYYQHAGERWERGNRGVLSRPTVQEVYAYRTTIDDRMEQLLRRVDAAQWPEVHARVVLGLHHEQQHQELLLTDIKYIFATNPLLPAYHHLPDPESPTVVSPAHPLPYAGGTYVIGYDGEGFCFDNEQPAHRVFVEDFRLQNRLVTNGEYLEFIADGGYQSFQHWLSEGWETVQREGWQAPLYWQQLDHAWYEMTLAGLRPLNQSAPVTHVSFYEAAAYARWVGKYLPSEAQWEVAARSTGVSAMGGNFVDNRVLDPLPWQPQDGKLAQMLGDVWEWTGSAYLPYPGYWQGDGALGEYNGKFMSGQMVLRGGSCATPRSHIRLTYRNFFHPQERWQFTGIRLAELG
jgi:ergothioneine biosynthesis protein EgtB